MRTLRATASATLLLFLVTFGCGCHHWRPVSLASVESQTRKIRTNSNIRLTFGDGSIREILVHSIHFPIVYGYEFEDGGSRRRVTVDLNDVYRLEISELDSVATAVVIVGSFAAIGPVLMTIYPDDAFYN